MKYYYIIFLDIDGVMNSVQYDRWNSRHHFKYGSIDPKECYRLSRFCKDYNIKLVISSSWRNGTSWKKTYNEFMTEGFEGLPYRHHGMKVLAPYIVGVTPYCESRHRGTEIQYFLDIVNGKYQEYKQVMKEDFKILNYCIVDDDNDMLDHQLNNFVQTNPWNGLTRKEYKKILKILFKDEYDKCIGDFDYFKKYIKVN